MTLARQRDAQRAVGAAAPARHGRQRATRCVRRVCRLRRARRPPRRATRADRRAAGAATHALKVERRHRARLLHRRRRVARAAWRPAPVGTAAASAALAHWRLGAPAVAVAVELRIRKHRRPWRVVKARGGGAALADAAEAPARRRAAARGTRQLGRCAARARRPHARPAARRRTARRRGQLRRLADQGGRAALATAQHVGRRT